MKLTIADGADTFAIRGALAALLGVRGILVLLWGFGASWRGAAAAAAVREAVRVPPMLICLAFQPRVRVWGAPAAIGVRGGSGVG